MQSFLEVNMKNFFDVLNQYVAENQPSFGDGESVLTLLYEAYSECNRLDDAQIKTDFNELYQLMNGMDLRDMDKIIYPVCKLCRDHERSGFVEGIKIGIMLAHELQKVLTPEPVNRSNVVSLVRHKKKWRKS